MREKGSPGAGAGDALRATQTVAREDWEGAERRRFLLRHPST